MLTINIRYKGKGDAAKRFAEEMISCGAVEAIRREEGNVRYEYYFPLKEDGCVLLIDSWVDQAALDVHHKSPMMEKIAKLREKYQLTMEVERYASIGDNPDDEKYIRK